jgi:hypothetical protein
VAIKPTISETRPPYIMRVSISRPKISVPSQCSREGLWHPAAGFAPRNHRVQSRVSAERPHRAGQMSPRPIRAR